jgi:hypothetical protein
MLRIEQYDLETIRQDASVEWLPESAIRERMRGAYSVERGEERREFVRDLARGGAPERIVIESIAVSLLLMETPQYVAPWPGPAGISIAGSVRSISDLGAGGSEEARAARRQRLE